MDPKKFKFHLAAIVGAILTIVLFNALKEKPINIPVDEQHRIFRDRAIATIGEEAKLIEQECLGCHGPRGTPFSKDHPSSLKCLTCHPLPG